VTAAGSGWTPSARQVERQAVRRRLRLRSALVATLATVVAAGLLVVGITSSPGWPTFR
jgi:polar amino acid transport system permease protein